MWLTSVRSIAVPFPPDRVRHSRKIRGDLSRVVSVALLGQRNGTEKRPRTKDRAVSFSHLDRIWESEAGLVKSWSCTSCAFIPISLHHFPPLAKQGAPFSPPCEGGQGGWFRHDQSQGLPMLSPSQSFRIPLARRDKSISLSKAPGSPPPRPPLRKGGKGSLARDVIPSRSTKTRVSKSSLQLSQHQLFTAPASPSRENETALGRPAV